MANNERITGNSNLPIRERAHHQPIIFQIPASRNVSIACDSRDKYQAGGEYSLPDALHIA